MGRQIHRPASFREVLASVSGRNASALMARAKVANHIAKLAEYHGRRNAYRVKVHALEALIRRFPERVEIGADPLLPLFVVVTVPDKSFGLHAPAHHFLPKEIAACAA